MADDQVDVLKQKAKEAIDRHSARLYDLSTCILQNPELAFKETYAHDQLIEFLAAYGKVKCLIMNFLELQPRFHLFLACHIEAFKKKIQFQNVYGIVELR